MLAHHVNTNVRLARQLDPTDSSTSFEAIPVTLATPAAVVFAAATIAAFAQGWAMGQAAG